MNFELWLKQYKGLSISTITIHSRYTEIFLQWLNNQDISINDARYSNVLEFINYLRKTGRTSHNINHVLGSVRYYYIQFSIYNTGNQKPCYRPVCQGYTSTTANQPIIFRNPRKHLQQLSKQNHKRTTQQTNNQPVNLSGSYHRRASQTKTATH